MDSNPLICKRIKRDKDYEVKEIMKRVKKVGYTLCE